MSFPSRPPVVAHFALLCLARTETFIYSVLTNHRRYRPIFLCQHDVGTADLFPFQPVYSDDYLKRRWSAHAWWQRLQYYFLGRAFHHYDSVLARHRARLLHLHFGSTGAMILPISRAFGIPQVTSFYGGDDTLALEQEAWRARFDRLFRDGEAFLVEGSQVAARLMAFGCPRERIHVHRIGVDLARIPFRPASPAAADGRPRRLLFCGRLVEKKGLGDAIRALAVARGEGYAAILHVIGDGPLRDAITQQVRASGLEAEVHFLGVRDYAGFLEELAACDLLIAPSVTAADGETEGGAPTVIIEAQAAGKPVLTTRHGDIPEIVRPGESAIVVPERAPQELGRALVDLLRHPERWAEMGAAGRRHVEAEHDIHRQMEKLESLYDDLIADAASGSKNLSS